MYVYVCMYNVFNYCTIDICIDKQLSHIFDFLHNKNTPKMSSHMYYHLLSNWYNNNNNKNNNNNNDNNNNNYLATCTHKTADIGVLSCINVSVSVSVRCINACRSQLNGKKTICASIISQKFVLQK